MAREYEIRGLGKVERVRKGNQVHEVSGWTRIKIVTIMCQVIHFVYLRKFLEIVDSERRLLTTILAQAKSDMNWY